MTDPKTVRNVNGDQLMLKICVFSDSHGAYKNLIAVAEKEHPDCVVFCGDGEKDIERFSQSFPDIRLYAVCGNCDFMSKFPDELSFSLAGINLFVCHGHMYKVKYEHDLATLKAKARAVKADIALFGHTHSADIIRMVISP